MNCFFCCDDIKHRKIISSRPERIDFQPIRCYTCCVKTYINDTTVTYETKYVKRYAGQAAFTGMREEGHAAAIRNKRRTKEKTMKKEYFSIPNLMGYLRILLIPVFFTLYLNAKTRTEYLTALLVLAVSYLTDFFDGKIARRFDMVTDWGKALDPVADKLTQGALALALTFRYPLMKGFLALFLVKEIYMGVMGLYLVKREKKINGAQWYGKICTAVIDIGIFALLLFPRMPRTIADLLLYAMMAVMLVTLARYAAYHVSVIRELNKEA